MEISDVELQDMVAEFDQDKDGMINEAEFMVSPGVAKRAEGQQAQLRQVCSQRLCMSG